MSLLLDGDDFERIAGGMPASAYILWITPEWMGRGTEARWYPVSTFYVCLALGLQVGEGTICIPHPIDELFAAALYRQPKAQVVRRREAARARAEWIALWTLSDRSYRLDW